MGHTGKVISSNPNIAATHLHFETLHATSLGQVYIADELAFNPMHYFSSAGVPVAASASVGGTVSEPQYDEDGRLIVDIIYDPNGAHCCQGSPEE